MQIRMCICMYVHIVLFCYICFNSSECWGLLINGCTCCFWQLGTLSVSELKVASLVGVSENQIARKASGHNFRQVRKICSSLGFCCERFCYNCNVRTCWDIWHIQIINFNWNENVFILPFMMNFKMWFLLWFVKFDRSNKKFVVVNSDIISRVFSVASGRICGQPLLLDADALQPLEAEDHLGGFKPFPCFSRLHPTALDRGRVVWNMHQLLLSGEV